MIPPDEPHSPNINTEMTENIKSSTTKTIGRITIVISIITWCLFLGWILSAEAGGLGPRYNVLTASYFNWHPFLMTSTFFLFMTPAVLSFEILPFHRSINKRVHGTLNSLSFISVICGLYIILDCHQNLHTPPIVNSSIHSICGYMTFSLLMIVYLIGFILFGIGCGSDELKKTAMPYHKRLGAVVLFCGYVTILSGLGKTINKETQLETGQL